MARRNVNILIIATTSAVVTYLNYVTMQGTTTGVVLDELYYLPLLLGVVWFGLKGGIFVYLLVSASYIPFLFDALGTTFLHMVDKVMHFIATAAFVLVAGLIAERERKRQERVEQERYFAGIGQASTVIVHDLKNPLISIQGFAQRILQGRGDAEQAARVILDSAETMQRIVNDVLEFARPSRLNLCECDVRQCIRGACEACLIKADEKGVTLAEQLPPKPVMREVDCYMLQRALVNLLDNAVDASPPGESVTVTATVEQKCLIVGIRDQGAGMDQETLDNLFTLTYTTKTEGTGFGVPIAKKIIEAHGGTIRIASRKGSGTEVIIDLPEPGSARSLP